MRVVEKPRHEVRMTAEGDPESSFPRISRLRVSPNDEVSTTSELEIAAASASG